MWAAIVTIIAAIVQKLWGTDSDPGVAKYVCNTAWDGAKAIGGAIWDWYNSDDVSFATKAATTLGAAYLVAPDLTDKVVNKTVGSLSNAAGTAVSNIGGSILDVLKQIPIWVWIAVAGFFLMRD
jgi:hypothetical protein